MRNNLVFLGQMARQPLKVGAVAPSGPILGRTMARDLSSTSGNVIELGGGTGAITKAILKQGLPEKNLCVFEINPVFVKKLKSRFPGVAILEEPAQNIAAAPFTDVEAIISGLPLLSFSRKLQQEILKSVFDFLPVGAPYIQFTYSTSSPISKRFIEEFGLTVEKRKRVYLNVPPATVFVYRKAA